MHYLQLIRYNKKKIIVRQTTFYIAEAEVMKKI